ncbi:MAG: phosphoribosylaminoimidazolesuccinocarboxamide synthase, partial [bacterium]|nr:phosphoribosylaminoimidazolesuccinocarboxamide synthase [bacterium]
MRETNLPNRLYRGKVRDTYDMGDGYLLMVATDRISAFDVVLPTAIPQKGLVLSRMSAFWFRKTAHIIPNHLLGLADEPAVQKRFKGNKLFDQAPPEVARQAMVVRRAQRVNVECIARGYLAGSAWAEYRKEGTACGIPLPKGLQEGSRLPQLLFTPTTKAESGHDENMTREEVVELVGADVTAELEAKTIAVYNYAHDYALSRGIVLADTKMEFGFVDGKLILIDELLTPDSSRFWDRAAYKPGQSQPNYDKQYVRDWLIQSGW